MEMAPRAAMMAKKSAAIPPRTSFQTFRTIQAWEICEASTESTSFALVSIVNYLD
jgi:hypothetical protein